MKPNPVTQQGRRHRNSFYYKMTVAVQTGESQLRFLSIYQDGDERREYFLYPSFRPIPYSTAQGIIDTLGLKPHLTHSEPRGKQGYYA